MHGRRVGGIAGPLSSGVLLALGAASAPAQVRLELEPAVGVYAGLGSFDRPLTQPFSFPEALSQRTAVALGGQATAWFGARAGVRLTLFIAASELGPESRDLLNRRPIPARVTVAGLEALVPLRSVSGGGRVFVAGGAALVRRSGRAYEGYEGTKDLGATLGLGSQFRLTDHLSLQGDARALLYSLHLTDPAGVEYDSAFQTDLLAHVGLVLSLPPQVED